MMNEAFKSLEFFRVPDMTLVSPFLNPKDINSSLPFDLLDGFSIAKGIIEKNVQSKIHLHKYVDQVVYVLSGEITVIMKGKDDKKTYSVELAAGQAELCRMGEFLQFDNRSKDDCYTLYILSPAYLFEMDGEEVIYDDAIVFHQDWLELEQQGWSTPELLDEKWSIESRQRSYERLKRKKS